MPSPRSGGTPPEVPEQFRDVYQRAYEQALGGVDDAPAGGPVADGVPASTARAVAGTDHRARPGWLLPASIVAGALVLVGCAYVLGRMVSGPADDPVEPASQSDSPSSPATPDPVPTHTAEPPRDAFAGEVVAVPARSAEAGCTAKPGVDASGRPVRYAAGNVLDGRAATAWRCDGEAIGERITFVLPAGSEIAEVGLIPGYAKTDAKSGADRYAENNRITRVTWILVDGTEVEQRLSADARDRSLRTIRVPATAGDQVTLQIDAVAKGRRNTTMISEVRFAAPAR